MRLIFSVIFFMFFCVSVNAQTVVEEMLFDNTTNKISNAILDASHKHAIYAYNLANLMTPGFQPILFDEDRERLETVLPGDESNSELMSEHFVARITEVRSKYSAYVKLMSTKMAITRQVATLGKK